MNKRPSFKPSVYALVILTTLFTYSSHAEDIPLTSPDFKIEGEVHEFVTYKGKEALKLKNAAAEIMSVDFGDGVIEFDIALPGERGFSGIAFHMGSGDQAGTMDEFYIRPHQRGMPDANQYTPIFNNVTGWQLYHGPQFSSDNTFEADAWQHVKIAISGTRADIYLDDMETVALAVPELKSGIASGGLQLYSSLIPAYFANLKITPDVTIPLKGEPTHLPETPETRVATWMISSSFSEKSLGENGTLEVDLNSLEWTSLAAEENGITNIARAAKISRETNTSLARLVITARYEILLPVKFGYSDAVRVYLDGNEVYRGTNRYQTRDYRYLGTIGLFDEVPLRLAKGNNTLVFAVTEAFGGWGIMADIEPQEGISVEAR